MKKSKIFLLFMGWFIFYSLLYFISLDITGDPPGKEGSPFHKVFNYGILLVVSFAGWWLSWKKFQRAYSPAAPAEGAMLECRFGLRNPELMYYLMVLKLFLLAMGANGIITLSQHTGGARTFYIINFIVLYLYAIPFFIMKFIKLKKALQAAAVFDEQGIVLQSGGKTLVQLPYGQIEQVLIEEQTGALLIRGQDKAICLGAPRSKVSPFYASGVELAAEKIRRQAPDKVDTAASLKQEMKRLNVKAEF